MLYAISDIHGHLKELEVALQQIDLSGENKVIFLGDYIDCGPNSYEVVAKLWELQKVYSEKVIVLKGNHEEMFLNFLFEKEEEWLAYDREFETVKSFLGEERLKLLLKEAALEKTFSTERFHEKIREEIRTAHIELLYWLTELPEYYETEKQIFVHAGVEEELGEYWKEYGERKKFLWKYPPTRGSFYKDVIAGHIAAEQVAGHAVECGIFYDGASHFYIDGNIEIRHRLPVLKMDTDTGKYDALWIKEGKEWQIKSLR